MLSLSLALALTTSAFADEQAPPPAGPTKIESDDAKGLVRALTLANLKSTKDKTKKQWAFKRLTCTTKEGKELWDLPDTSCEADGKKVTGAAAVLLEEAMNAAKIPAPYMMAMKQVRAADITCTQSNLFVCTYTPMARGDK